MIGLPSLSAGAYRSRFRVILPFRVAAVLVYGMSVWIVISVWVMGVSIGVWVSVGTGSTVWVASEFVFGEDSEASVAVSEGVGSSEFGGTMVTVLEGEVSSEVSTAGVGLHAVKSNTAMEISPNRGRVLVVIMSYVSEGFRIP